MEITPEIRAIKNAYMKARNDKDLPEMNRLKAKAMTIMNSEKPDSNQKIQNSEKIKETILKNKDGDSIEISLIGRRFHPLAK